MLAGVEDPACRCRNEDGRGRVRGVGAKVKGVREGVGDMGERVGVGVRAQGVTAGERVGVEVGVGVGERGVGMGVRVRVGVGERCERGLRVRARGESKVREGQVWDW